MLLENFRTVGMELGNYCPIKNELRIHRRRKVFRVTCCGKGELRLAARARPEVVIIVATDATVPELRHGISSIIDSYEAQ